MKPDNDSRKHATSPTFFKVILVLLVAPIVIKLTGFFVGLPIALVGDLLPAELQAYTLWFIKYPLQLLAIATGIFAVWKLWPREPN